MGYNHFFMPHDTSVAESSGRYPKPRSYGTGPGHLAFEGRKGSAYFAIYLLFVPAEI
jgi:hypothetical protein